MTLVSLPANPVPEDVVTGTIKTLDGAELRFARWAPPAGRKGTVCVFTGRGEQIEKYFETVRDLRDRGFAVAMIDWRGQWQSSRRLRDHRKGHVRDFGDFEVDVETFVQQVVLPDCPPPFFALAHSMGGAVMLRVAHAGKRWFDRMVLSAPMIDLPGHRTGFAARALLRILRLAGQGRRYVPGGNGELVGAASLINNPLTSDPVRYARNAAILEEDPTLGIGSPTVAWADTAFKAMRGFRASNYPSQIRQPILMLAARHATSVSPARISSSPARSTKSCRSRTATARNSGRRSMPSCRARRCSSKGRVPMASNTTVRHAPPNGPTRAQPLGIPPNSILGRWRRCFVRRRQSRLGSPGAVRVLDALRLSNVGECAVEFVHAIEDDAAIDVGICKARIVLDRPIEVGDRAMEVAIAVREDSALPVGFGVVRREVGSRTGIGDCLSAVRIRRGCKGARQDRVVRDRCTHKLVPWLISAGGLQLAPSRGQPRVVAAH